MKSFQTFLLQEDLNQTLLNDIYVTASLPIDTEEYGQRIWKINTQEIMERFQHMAWPEILNIITTEFCHITSQLWDKNMDTLMKFFRFTDEKKFNIFFDKLAEIEENNYDITFQDVNKIFQKFNLELTLDIMIQSFDELEWTDEYGGKAWGHITKSAKDIAISLYQKDFGKFYKALDHFVDLAHNTDSILNKFKGYDEMWLFHWIDLKRYARSVYDLNPISKSVQEYRKMVHRELPPILKQKTHPQQSLYEVLLRGKKFTEEITGLEVPIASTEELSTIPPEEKIYLLEVLKKNHIRLDTLLRTVRQIIDDISTSKETLIENQEWANFRALKSFMGDWWAFFCKLRRDYVPTEILSAQQIKDSKITPIKLANVLRNLGLSNNNDPTKNLQVVDFWKTQLN